MNDEELLIIKPNEDTVLELSEPYQNHFINLMSNEEDQPELLCRAIIQDQSDHGIILPAKLTDSKEIIFNLPEQLCIFNPNKTYFLKIEVVLETELVTPIFKSCQIDLNGLIAPEEEENEPEEEEELNASNEPYKQLEDDLTLDAVLEAVAPLPKVVVKKTKVEEIVKQLDEEFVKNALWKQQTKQPPEQMQIAPIPVKVPEPSSLTPEQLVIKQKMKNLLRGMIS